MKMINYGMSMEREEAPKNRSLVDVARNVVRRFAIENLDPSDWGLGLVTPQIVPEHIARYEMAVDLAKELGLGKISVIVDMACGRGYGLDILRQTGASVLGVELGKEYVKVAKKRYGLNENKKSGIVVGNVMKSPVGSEMAGLVTAFEILEHLPREKQPGFMAEIERTLKPGGIAIVSFPERYSFRIDPKKGLVRIGVLSSNPHHLYEPTMEEVKQMISETSLKIVDERGQFIVDEKEVLRVKKVARYLPIWPLYMWGIKREVKPQKMDEVRRETEEGRNQIALTHILILQKNKDRGQN